MKKRLFTITLLSAIVITVFAQPLRQDPAVRTGKLKNGMTYYIRHNAKEPGLADFYIAQKVGTHAKSTRMAKMIHRMPLTGLPS